ncbi:MAG TPA: aminotransferase class IV, partial [Longimicrobiales bacterium]|nr:aminotransferase class IV [Longimicrobiales bacterium]
ELLAKAVVVRSPRPEFRLLETLRLHDGTLVRLDRHLARLRGSAEHFGFPLLDDAVRAALDGIRHTRPDGTHRVRLLVDDAGSVEAEATEEAGEMGLDGPGSGAPRSRRPVMLARSRVDPRDRFLYHKTTHREIHDRARAEAPDLWDVLLVNERDELTEFTSGNLVIERDGSLLTPPLDAGLLPGCLRGELLDAGTIVEEKLTAGDLDRASRVWFINSLRGWIEVRVDLRTP